MWLVMQAQRGDADAFVELIEKHKKSLYKVAKSYMRCEEDVADAMSETVLSAYEHIKELKNPMYFKTWITRILINQCKSMLQEQNKYWLTEELEEPAYEEHTQSDIEFYEILEELPEQDRILFVLYYGEGFTTKQISGILGIKENTIVSRLSRGRKKLYDFFQNEAVL